MLEQIGKSMDTQIAKIQPRKWSVGGLRKVADGIENLSIKNLHIPSIKVQFGKKKKKESAQLVDSGHPLQGEE